MAAETEVPGEVPEVSGVATGEKCGLEMSSFEDLAEVGGDRNGANEHVDGDKEEKQGENSDVNGTGTGKDDPDGSYVFVSWSEPVNGDPKDVDGQHGELNDENVKTAYVEDNGVAKGTDVAPDRSVFNPNVDGYEIATTAVEFENGENFEKIDTDSAPDLEENREFQTQKVEPDSAPALEENQELITRRVEPDSAPAFEENRELQTQKVEPDSASAVVENRELQTQKVEPDSAPALEENQELPTQKAESDSAPALEENGELQTRKVEPDSAPAVVENRELQTQKVEPDSAPVLEENQELPTLKVEPDSAPTLEENWELQTRKVEPDSAPAIVENRELQTQKVEPDAAPALEENRELPTQKVEADSAATLEETRELPTQKVDLDSATDFGENRELPTQEIELDSSPALEEDRELPSKKIDPDSALAIEKNEELSTKKIEPDSAHALEANQEVPTIPQFDNGNVESEEQIALETSTCLGEVKESQVVPTEAGDLQHVEEELEVQESQVVPPETGDLQHVEEESEVQGSQVVPTEAGDLQHVGEKSEVQESHVVPTEAVDVQHVEEKSEVQESQVVPTEPGDLQHAEEKSEEQNNLESIASVEEESQTVISEAAEYKSSLLDDGKVDPNENAVIGSTTDLEESCQSQGMVSESAECQLPEAEEMKMVSEEQTKLESLQEVQESLESQIALPESAESESYRPDSGDGKVKEERKTDLGMDSKENLESQLAAADNVSSAINEGNEGGKLSSEADVPLKIETANGHVSGENENIRPTSNVEDSISQAKILNELIDGSQNTTELNGFPENVSNGIDKGNKVGNMVTDCASSQPNASARMDLDYHGNDSLRNGSSADVKSESEVDNSSFTSGRDRPCNEVAVSQSEVLEGSDGSCGSASNCVMEASDLQDVGDHVTDGDRDDNDNHTCQKSEDTVQVQLDESSTSSSEVPSADALDEQRAVCVDAGRRPFNFLVKIPRYDDEKLREQIRVAQLRVDEKTRQRDAIRVDIQMIRANCQQLRHNYEAAKSEERAARGLVKLKRQEIDSVQSVINRVKNAISVEDIDVRIHSMEHMIQHETLPLKEEKLFIREIKQLKHLREQLSSNMGSQDEVQQALDQRDQIEERLKVLKKELDCLKEKVSKAEATAGAAEKRYNNESKKLKELHAQFKAADNIRQEAYMHYQNLRKQLYEKNTRFRMYKDDATAANDYALSGDKEALHRLCVNEVESFMDQWNKNDEFREEYLKCNARSTLRRLRTLDGRALGPDEEPTILPNVVDERIDRSLSTSGDADSEFPILAPEQEKQVPTVEGKKTVGTSTAKVPEKMGADTKRPGKPTLNVSTAVSGRDGNENVSEEERNQTKEEQELAKREEEIRSEAEAAKLREQRRLEEKAKAKEALERKRKNAEKAQFRAELRAQKEAEQKEKEREKRAKKKERKKAAAPEAPEGNSEGETVPTLESPVVITKESEIKESPLTTTKRPQKPFPFTKQSKTKSIPPPLRNRGKRKMQQWIWIILTVLLVLVLFLLGNIGFYSNLGPKLRMRSPRF